MLSNYARENISLFEVCLTSQDELAEKSVTEIIARLEAGHKVFTIGNGGSAGHAADFISELKNRFSKTYRKRLRATCLAANVPLLTAISNDHGNDYIFADQLEADGEEDDVLVGFSTSGNSPNIVLAFQRAKESKLYTIGFGGKLGSKMVEYCDICFFVPHDKTDIVQNGHSVLYHYICQKIDDFYLGKLK